MWWEPILDYNCSEKDYIKRVWTTSLTIAIALELLSCPACSRPLTAQWRTATLYIVGAIEMKRLGLALHDIVDQRHSTHQRSVEKALHRVRRSLPTFR